VEAYADTARSLEVGTLAAARHGGSKAQFSYPTGLALL